MPDIGGLRSRWWQIAHAVWNSARLFSLILLVVAVVLGAHLRFHRLKKTDMNGDEGATWAAASAPTFHAVVQTEQRLDPGKLALFDLILHGWIRLFGDSLFSMRALSAGLGTLGIVLLFAAVRETCLCLADEPLTGLENMAGAFAALILATNVTMVLASRLARMYPLVLAAEFLQILFLMRAQRRGGLGNYVGVAFFTAVMIAANFTASLLLMAEGLWLGVIFLAKWAGARIGGLAIFRPGFAILAGIGLLAPALLSGALKSAGGAVRFGAIDWIKVQAITWPYTVLRDSAGSDQLFWIFVALGAWGTWRQWGSARLASAFMAIWMAGPLLGVLAVTYLIHSLEFYRYVLIAFAGLFAIAALGAASFRSTIIRVALVALIGYLSIGPTQVAIRHPYEADWRKAVALATATAATGEGIAVFPPWCDNVVRFYVGPARRAEVSGLNNCRGPARILLLSGRDFEPPDRIAAMEKCYSHLIAQLSLVEVRSR